MSSGYASWCDNPSNVRQHAPGIGGAIHVLRLGFDLRHQFDQTGLALRELCLQSLNVLHFAAQRVEQSAMFPASEVAGQQPTPSASQQGPSRYKCVPMLGATPHQSGFSVRRQHHFCTADHLPLLAQMGLESASSHTARHWKSYTAANTDRTTESQLKPKKQLRVNPSVLLNEYQTCISIAIQLLNVRNSAAPEQASDQVQATATNRTTPTNKSDTMATFSSRLRWV